MSKRIVSPRQPPNTPRRVHFSGSEELETFQAQINSTVDGQATKLDENDNTVGNGETTKIPQTNGDAPSRTPGRSPRRAQPSYMDSIIVPKKEGVDEKHFKNTMKQLFKAMVELEKLVAEQNEWQSEKRETEREVKTIRRLKTAERFKYEEELCRLDNIHVNEPCFSSLEPIEITKEFCQRIYTYSFGRLKRQQQASLQRDDSMEKTSWTKVKTHVLGEKDASDTPTNKPTKPTKSKSPR